MTCRQYRPWISSAALGSLMMAGAMAAWAAEAERPSEEPPAVTQPERPRSGVDVDVDVPTTRVEKKDGRVTVDAPFTHIERTPDGVRVRAPFVDLVVPRR